MSQDSHIRRTRLRQLDEEIPSLRLHLEQLERERALVFESLKFPVLTLPAEITSEIFFNCLPQAPCDPSLSDAPLLLTRVCRHWRNIALSNQQLWSTLSFPADVDAMNCLDRDNLMSLWLSRSGQHPLSIRLHYRSYDVPSYTEDCAELDVESTKACLRVICQHSSRWRDLDLNLSLSSLDALSNFELTGGLPVLRHLSIGVGDYEGVYSKTIDIFAKAPRLRSVELRLDPDGSVALSAVSFPWTQLTSFIGHNFSIEEALEVLCRASSLVHCALSLFGSGPDEIELFPPQPSLKSFTVTAASPYSTPSENVFNVLTLPGLQALTIEAKSAILDFHPLTSMLTRSSCALRFFSCSTVDANALPQFLRSLRCMSSLSILELGAQSPRIGVGIIEALTDDSVLIPQLESIAISCRRGGPESDFPFSALLRMLQSRRSSDRPTILQVADMTWGRVKVQSRDAETIGPFKELVRQGMVIRLKSTDYFWM
ncbi:hypothetical protein C8J57DRAFT_1170597 [Mycena rebaudengoi]|nr:hypothetical protein C8J57DRAFT_1170597 [Mycena rebaudengoi]